MSIWTDGLPAWWAMVVAVAALGVGVLLGWRYGRSVGYLQAKEDRKADAAVRQVRAWREGPATREEAMARRTHPVYRQRRTSTEAFLRPPPEVAHEAWLAHTEQAMDLANDDPTVSAWTQQMAESMDQWLEAHVYSVPIPYLPETEKQ
jgi:hypothetical protein